MAEVVLIEEQTQRIQLIRNSNKTPLYLIGELIGVPNMVMDSALHELKDRIDKDPKYKDVKNWLESLPKI